MKGKNQTSQVSVPNSWTHIFFSEVFEFIQSIPLSRDQLTLDDVSDSVYNIHYGDIHATYNSTILDFNKENRVPKIKENLDKLDGNLIKEGDLAIADVSEDYDGVAACIEITNVGKKKVVGGLHTFIARDKSGLTTPGFRTYILKHPSVATEIKKLATGSKVFGISKTNLSSLKILIPSISEQQKIAQILSTWDKGIETLEKLIEKKERRKKALMQLLLTGKKRFKEFEGEKWESRRLSSCLLGKGEYGINAPAVPFSETKPRYLRITDIDENGNYSKNNQVSVDDVNYKNFLLKQGDIVFARTGNTTGKTYLYNTNDGQLVYAGFLIKFHPDPAKLDCVYLKHFTQTKDYWKWVKLMSLRSGQPGINEKEYSSLSLLLPEIKEQNKIAKILSSLDYEVHLIRRQLNHCVQQKSGLMQVLLTGKIRVKV